MTTSTCTITFTVPAVPVAQPRPRAVIAGNRARVHEVTHIKTPNGRKPHPIAAYKATVRHSLQDVYDGAPLSGAITVDLLFVLPRPQRMMWRSRPMPREPHISRPDVDNLIKGVLDALNGLAWRDDTQIAAMSVAKCYAAGDEQPHVCVEIQTH